MVFNLSRRGRFVYGHWHAVCSSVARVDRITPIRQIEGTFMFKKLIFCFAALAAVSLTACNTMQGAGKDVERGGQKVQEEAKEVQKKM